MKFLLALFLTIYSFALFSQETAGIAYSPDVDFNWSLFKGKVNPQHVAAVGINIGAVTVSSLNFTSIVKGSTASIKVSALFFPSESWTRYPKLEHPDEALNHEKHHFDICEIYARKIRQTISRAHFIRGNFNRELNYIFNKLANEERAEQFRYDRETKHSIDTYQQKKWNDRVDEQLKMLSAYSNPIVTITLN